MKTPVRMLLASAALVAAMSISAQTYTQVIGYPGSAPTPSNPAGPWFADTGNPGAGADLSGNNAQHYTTPNAFGLTTSIRGTGSAPSEAHAFLDSVLSTNTLNSSFDGDVWISFSAQRISGNAWANLKLLDTAYTNTYCVLGIGETTGGSSNWQYGIGQSGSAPFTSTGLIGEASSLNTGNYFVIHIAYNPLASDELSIWRSTTPISGIQTTIADVNLNGVDATFDRFAIYAGESTTFAVGDITITQIPEPSTYALLFGAATLGFVGYRRFRKHQA